MSPFPDPAFAWISYLALVGFAAVAAYTDLSKAIIPNKLNLTILAVGVLMNLTRGGWLGATGKRVWWLCTESSANVWLGLADGFLFSLAGFVLAFAVLTGLWMLTQTGAGDVKLFAALGAWVGAYGFVWVWMVSLPLLMVWMGLKAAFGAPPTKQEKKNGSRMPKGWRTRTTYSLPIAVSVVLCGLWLYRKDLQLDPSNSPAPPAPVGTGSPDGTPPTNPN